MKILLLGKNGQVGWELQRALAALGEVIALGSESGTTLNGNFLQPQAVAATVHTVQPKLIVNAAAYTAVDKAQSDVQTARTINATTAGALARAAAQCGAWLVHYSTDYVFDGSGSSAWAESSATGPLNVYGQTKLEGEQLIAASGCKHLIFRTSWVYAARGGNFAKTMLRLALEREALSVINDQICAPTGADLLADITAHAVRTVLSDSLPNSHLSGLYHATAAGHTSWHGYAQHVIEWARAAGQPIKVAHQHIAAVPSSTFSTAAQRPLNSRLCTRKLQTTFHLEMPSWQNGVDRLLGEILPSADP
jgi:dTDP-4-dehydrorhamnose reductase